GILIIVFGFILVMLCNFSPPIDFDDPLLGLFVLIRSVLLGIVLSLPYIATRLIKRRRTDFLSTLIFPFAVVGIYFLESIYGPFDGVIIFYAYTQYGNMPLVQLLSIGGPWLLIFLLSWFSSAACWFWEKDFNFAETKKGISIFVGIAVILVFYGGYRISPFSHDYENKSVRIAAAVLPSETLEKVGFIQLMNERLFSPMEETLQVIENTTKQAALSGAKIIVFQEFSFIVLEKEEQKAIQKLKRMARENKIYMCVCYVSMPELLPGEHEYSFGIMELSDEEEEGRNMAILIDDSGEILTEYQKTNMVFGEDNWVLRGSGKVPVVHTPYGKVGVVICRDMEFSDYMRKAKNADIVLAPSYEAVKSLSITYAQMLRSVENGFSFVRACGNGLSVAVDYNGKILSSQNNFTSSNNIMYA
ncbi:MAG: carbon-nitrogen hydrolase family protein, partial [Halanaerobiales bacterium]|nr:carbon-nitrogen hydrolase family protein [Halanaerobiales bacterium]